MASGSWGLWPERHADDDEQAVREYVAQRERMGAELVVVVRSLATRPAGQEAQRA
jgi:hypothetical protein